MPKLTEEQKTGIEEAGMTRKDFAARLNNTRSFEKASARMTRKDFAARLNTRSFEKASAPEKLLRSKHHLNPSTPEAAILEQLKAMQVTNEQIVAGLVQLVNQKAADLEASYRAREGGAAKLTRYALAEQLEYQARELLEMPGGEVLLRAAFSNAWNSCREVASAHSCD